MLGVLIGPAGREEVLNLQFIKFKSHLIFVFFY